MAVKLTPKKLYREVMETSRDKLKRAAVRSLKSREIPDAPDGGKISGKAIERWLDSLEHGPKRKLTVIHVNQHVIRYNLKHGRNEPPLTVRKGRSGRKAQRANEVVIHGPSRVIHRPHKPLSCGARVWIETYALVELK